MPGSDGSGRRLKDLVRSVHGELRARILTNELRANTELKQLQLAKEFDVSRGTVREALRMLHAEGLVDVAHNQRWRIAPLDPSAVDAIYAHRILIEVLGVRMTVPHLTDDELEQVRRCYDAMEANLDNVDHYLVPHEEFHALLISRLPPGLFSAAESLRERAERSRRSFAAQVSATLRADSLDEHRLILRAAEARQVDEASASLAGHYASVARRVLLSVAPDYVPSCLREACLIAGGEGELLHLSAEIGAT